MIWAKSLFLGFHTLISLSSTADLVAELDNLRAGPLPMWSIARFLAFSHSPRSYPFLIFFDVANLRFKPDPNSPTSAS